MKTFHSIIGLSCLALIAACSPQKTEQQAAPAQSSAAEKVIEASQQPISSEQLASFFEQSFETNLKNSPMFQSFLGIKWDYDKWDDLSEAAVEANVKLMKDNLSKAQAFNTEALSPLEKQSLDIYIEDLQRKLANDAFRHHTYIVHQFRALHTFVPSFLINFHRVTNLEDAQAYMSRLQGVEPLFQQLIEQMRLREKQGTFPPKWSYDQMITASSNVISGAPYQESEQDSTIWSDVKNKIIALELPEEQTIKLLDEAKLALVNKVKPAYQLLIAELEKQRELTPEGDGVWRLTDGDQWYKNRLEWFTTTDLSAEEVHNIGVEHVARIHEEMRAIMQQVKFEGDLQAFFSFMREDDQFYYPNTDEGRQAYMDDAKAFIDEMEQKIPEYFGLIPKAEMIIKRVEPFREKSAGKAFYNSPAKDGSRPGIYYANLYNMRDMPKYQMEALAYHEGIPGHHMQRSIAQELEGIPEFQKYVSFTAYTEGWGLYTEELPKEMGFYRDPYSDFGRLAMELWRACRLVVDTGLHAKQWSREQAIDYLIANTPNPANDAVKAIERYIAMPGQATAYMIGKLKIMQLRETAKTKLGDAFSIKDGYVPVNCCYTVYMNS
jgi:uncharacterized protein (DUF885 family)